MIERSSIPARLAKKFSSDYKSVMEHYNTEDQIELSKYLQGVFNIYLSEEESTKERLKWMNDESERLKRKFGKNFTAFRFGGLFYFLHFDIVLVEKGLYTPEEYENTKEQNLSKDEKSAFLSQALVVVQLHLDDLYLQSEPETSIKIETVNEEKPKKGKIKREANDKRTILSQEQTVLLMFYLQQEKAILKDEYLNDKEAGQAFEMLTGYSQHTLRQNLGKYYQIQNRENLKELDNLLTRLKIRIDKDLKDKKS
jgi:hypothetical protein